MVGSVFRIVGLQPVFLLCRVQKLNDRGYNIIAAVSVYERDQFLANTSLLLEERWLVYKGEEHHSFDYKIDWLCQSNSVIVSDDWRRGVVVGLGQLNDIFLAKVGGVATSFPY